MKVYVLEDGLTSDPKVASKDKILKVFEDI
jgi:hypothetical protein